MARKKQEKNPYELVEKEFMSAIDGSSEEEINQRIAEVAKNDAALMDAKKKDPHLKELKEQVKQAGAIYRDGHATNKQKIAYARSVLAGKGKDDGDAGLDERTGMIVPEGVTATVQIGDGPKLKVVSDSVLATPGD